MAARGERGWDIILARPGSCGHPSGSWEDSLPPKSHVIFPHGQEGLYY